MPVTEVIKDIESYQPLTFMDRVRMLLPANRVIALIGIVGSIAAFLVTIQSSFVPGSPGEEAIAKAIVMLGALGALLGTVFKFLHGSQKFDELVMKEPTVVATGDNNTMLITDSRPQVESPVEIEPAEELAARISWQTTVNAEKPPEALPDHPENSTAPNHEITEEDVMDEFGSLDEIQPDVVNPDATAQRLADDNETRKD